MESSLRGNEDFWVDGDSLVENISAFCDEDGFMLLTEDIEEIRHPVLTKLQGSTGLARTIFA